MTQSRKSLMAIAVASAITACGATAASAQGVTTWATVTQSRPIYAQVGDPQQRCWSERVIDQQVMRVDEAPIGVHGAVIPQPHGNDLVAVPREHDIQRCGTVDATRMQLQGYEVHYVYGGREYTTQMPYDPGQRLRVNVDVQPETR
jgi:uncharacterized protein YcfJ